MYILLVWDAAGETPVNAQFVEALVWKTQTFEVSRQIKPSHWLLLALMQLCQNLRAEPNCLAWIAVRGWDLLQLRWEVLSSTVSPVWQLLSGDKAF